MLSIDADERVTPALAAEIRALLAREPAARGYRDPARQPGISDAGSATTDWYPDYQLRLYDRRAGRWNGRRVHESLSRSTAAARAAARRAAALRLPRHLAAPRDDRSLHDAGRRADAAEGRRAVARWRSRCIRRSRSCATTSCAAGSRDGAAGLVVSVLNAYYVFLKLAKLWELQRTHAGVERRTALMFSLHIDTARTWRGGQNQVLLRCSACARSATAPMLVAHADGELRRRADGRARPHAAGAADRDGSLGGMAAVARCSSSFEPDIVHAHDPHGVAMAALALSMSTQLAKRAPLVAARRVDFHLRGNALSRWKYRQVDCFICASDAIRKMLVADGVPPSRTVTVHEGIDLGHVDGGAAGRAARGALAAAPRADRRQRRRAGAAQGSAPPGRGRGARGPAGARRALRHRRRRRAARDARAPDQASTTSRSTCFLAGFRPDVLSLHKAFDIFVMSSVTEGLGTSLLDAMACGKPIVATTAGGMPEVVEDGETGLLVPPRDHDAMADAIVRLLKDERCGGGWAPRDGRVRERSSAPSGWCRTRSTSTAACAAAAPGGVSASLTAPAPDCTTPACSPSGRADSRRRSPPRRWSRR